MERTIVGDKEEVKGRGAREQVNVATMESYKRISFRCLEGIEEEETSFCQEESKLVEGL